MEIQKYTKAIMALGTLIVLVIGPAGYNLVENPEEVSSAIVEIVGAIFGAYLVYRLPNQEASSES